MKSCCYRHSCDVVVVRPEFYVAVVEIGTRFYHGTGWMRDALPVDAVPIGRDVAGQSCVV